MDETETVRVVIVLPRVAHVSKVPFNREDGVAGVEGKFECLN